MSRPRIIDLFCGCSGFGLGARQAGFAVPLSVDIDPILTSSHKLNFLDGKVLLSDLSTANGRDLSDLAGGGKVDGVIGGPPCQGFSSIGRADPGDPRRQLLATFFRIVSEIQPRFFIMENVRGLLFEKNRSLLESAMGQVADRYEIVGPVLIDASQFGAATKRSRVFVVGYDPKSVDVIRPDELQSPRSASATVADAISDLSGLEAIGRSDGFDEWLHNSDFELSTYASRLRAGALRTTGHSKTPHRADVSERFALVKPGEVDRIGRYPRLRWDGLAPTLRAGTGSDRGSYQAVRPLHPSEHRVITVREAARLQGFPDWFRFHPTTWHSFRMIGNSVSPIVSSSLLNVLKLRSEPNSILAAE